MKNGVLWVLLWCLIFNGTAQEEVIIIDAHSKETLPFVKVIPSIDDPQLTDIDGKVLLDLSKSQSFKITFFDYKDTTLTSEQILALKNKTIEFVPDAQLYDEVIIRPGENPAHRIIKNVINNRKNNNPLLNNSFSYNSFSRFYATGEPIEKFDRDTVTDTSLMKTIEFLDKQYLFLTETAATRIFSPPDYDKEVVHSYKVSGTKHPMFATLVNQMQSFSFYDNIFSIFGSEYINPIAPGGIRRYLFILEDTLVKNQDTTYTIQFRPRKGKNFEGLKGYLYINTKGWAIERVISEPFEPGGFAQIKIIQEYRFTNNKKWFPYNISTEYVFKNTFVGENHEVGGKSNLYISNVEFDIPVKKRFNAVKLEVEKDALDDTLGLEKARGNPSNEKEMETYRVVDSVAKAENFDKYLEIAQILSTGKIPLKKFNIPLNRLMGYNDQEGYRLGGGLETNRRLSKHFTIGGYFAYGFRDQSWKWGGNLDVNLYEKKDLKLSLLYFDDLFERGGVDFRKDQFDLTSGASFRDFFINSFERERKASVGLSGLVTPNLKIQAIGNYRRIHFVDNYLFEPTNQVLQNTGTPFDLAETGLITTWNIREKVMMLGDQRVSLGTKFPKLTLKAVKGWDNLLGGEYDYYRFNFDIEQNFSLLGIGNLTLKSSSGLTHGDVPITLQHVSYGTAINWSITVPNTFETMFPAEFFSDRQSSLFMRLTLLPFKNETKWTEPQISIHGAATYGSMNNRFDHQNLAFSVPDKGFFETGIIANNLLKFGFNGFGLGAFYRMGHYAFDDWKDNFVYKISFTFNF